MVFHNLRGYDSYHIIQELAEWSSVSYLDVITKSMEKFTCLTLNKQIWFIDSLQFMQDGLDTLVRNLDNSLSSLEDKLEAFYPLIQWHRFMSGLNLIATDPEILREQLSRLTKKAVYPYELATKVSDLFHITTLPTKEQFTFRLRGTNISESEYCRAGRAWKHFKCAHLTDYTRSYCELDVLLLANIFETFCTKYLQLQSYRLDPVHFVTTPSLLLRHALQEPESRSGD